MIKKIIALILSVKITIFVIIFLAFNLLPTNIPAHYLNFLYPKNQGISIMSAYKTWDAQHYLYLSEKGYGKDAVSDAFSPLFPITIGLANVVFHSYFFSGLILSNSFSVIGIIIFYFFVKDFYKNKEIAFSSILLLLSFPTSFYFSLIYTESLFFLISICFFHFLYKKRFFLASIFALLLPFARYLGILIFFPFLTFFIEFFRSKKVFFKKENLKFFLILAPLVGFIFYLFFMKFTTGNYFEGIIAQSYFVAQKSFFNVFRLDLLIINFFAPNLAVHGFTNSVLDRIFFVAFLAFSPLVFKRTDRSLFIFYLLLGLVPLLGTFMSYTRYMVVLFPLFMSLGSLVEEKRWNFLKFPAIFFLFGLQIIFLIMQCN